MSGYPRRAVVISSFDKIINKKDDAKVREEFTSRECMTMKPVGTLVDVLLSTAGRLRSLYGNLLVLWTVVKRS